MTGQVQVTARNGPQLRRALKNLEGGLADLKAVNLEVAKVVAEAARTAAPRRTGRLASAHQAKATKVRAQVVVNVPYAGPVHWGWRRHNIEPNPWLSEAAQRSEPQWTDRYHTEIQKLVDRVGEAALMTTVLPYITATAIFDDGSELAVLADQRDQRRAMLPPPAGAGVVDPAADPIGFLRATAWANLVRTGRYSGNWPTFDTACSFVQPDPDAEDGADPYDAGYGRLIAELAVALHLAPSVLWEQDPRDLATLVDVLQDHAERLEHG